MPRNFGVRTRPDDFWNGSAQDCERDHRWAYWAIAAAVAFIVALAFLA